MACLEIQSKAGYLDFVRVEALGVSLTYTNTNTNTIKGGLPQLDKG